MAHHQGFHQGFHQGGWLLISQFPHPHAAEPHCGGETTTTEHNLSISQSVFQETTLTFEA